MFTKRLYDENSYIREFDARVLSCEAVSYTHLDVYKRQLTISGLLNSNLDQTLVLMNTQNQETAEVINSYVYRMGLAQGDFSYATAAGLGVSIVSVVLLVQMCIRDSDS